MGNEFKNDIFSNVLFIIICFVLGIIFIVMGFPSDKLLIIIGIALVLYSAVLLIKQNKHREMSVLAVKDKKRRR